MANDNKIEFQVAPPVHAREGSTIRSRAASEIASQRPRPIHHSPLQSTGCSLAIPDFLIANLELEFLASDSKRGLLRFSNRKKIAVFYPRRRGPVGEWKELSSPVTRHLSLITPLLIATVTNSRFESTYCKHAPYRISNRDKNAYLAFFGLPIASHRSRATNHDPRITSRAAFRSTIPQGQNAHH